MRVRSIGSMAFTEMPLLPLDRQDMGQTDEAHLRRALARLTEAGRRAGEDNAAVARLTHSPPGGLGDKERPLQMHIQDRVEVLGDSFANEATRRMPALLTKMSTHRGRVG